MQLDKIITLANKHTRLPFLAMERSLRAQGCDLPLEVIPYDNNRFDLPKNAYWLEDANFFTWLEQEKGLSAFRKYRCLLEANYQYVDTDCIFIKNPQQVLAPFDGFVASCCHWHNPRDTQTPETMRIFKERTTTWHRLVFNTGQFACSQALYSADLLMKTAKDDRYRKIILGNPFHEQPGFNFLVFLTTVPVINVTLPPYAMESSWAGDYTEDYNHYWSDFSKKPYLIHWAGCKADGSRPIDKLFFQYLSQSEQKLYKDYFLGSRQASWINNLKMKLRSVWHKEQFL